MSDFATTALRERKKGAGLRVLEPEFCTSTDTGRILVTVLGMVAEMERRFIVERQRAGIEAAKKKGVYKGRKASVPSDIVCRMRDEGKAPAEIAEALASVWRALNGRAVLSNRGPSASLTGRRGRAVATVED